MVGTRASFSVVDSHTAGHPTRVILSGVPNLHGRSVREKRDEFRTRFDGLRSLLLHEPRGHAAMVGLVPTTSEIADYGAFFISTYVYLDMCGHGTIGYAKTLAATGQISPATGDSFTLETPAGVVTVTVDWAPDGELQAVRLRNVPSYVGIEDLVVHSPELGDVHADIVYGGMWYALVDARALGLDLAADNVSNLLGIGSRLKQQFKTAVAGRPELGPQGIDPVAPSVLFYAEDDSDSATHLLVLDTNKFDRSPCGTATAARVSQLVRRNALAAGKSYQARNILGVNFMARPVEHLPDGAVVVEVTGNAHLTAFSTIVVERSDPLKDGFLCR